MAPAPPPLPVPRNRPFQPARGSQTSTPMSESALGVAFSANIENLRQFLSNVTGTTLFDPTIYFLSQMPSKIETSDVVAVVGMSLTLSFLATLYPSWRAARLDPVEALRYE